MNTIRVLFVGLLIAFTDSKSAQEWKSRIIYQLLTDRFSRTDDVTTNCAHLREYCGGTFKGIQKRLGYISDLGANAIWISPFVENTPGGYHGYWAKDIYKVNPAFGTVDDLKALIKACHDRDIWVMMDIVANHMGYPAECKWNVKDCTHAQLFNFTGFVPFNNAEYYHDYCQISDFTNQTEVELCRLANLPDLNQSNPFTHGVLLSWIRNITNEYNFDGYRIDTAVLVPKDFWAEFQEAGGVFMTGEANNGENITYLSSYQGPLNSVLNFPLYWALRHVFNEFMSMKTLSNSLTQQKQHFLDATVLGIFLDNHDFPRFLSLTSSPHNVLLKNVLTYVLLGEGIPIIYYGTEQSFHGVYDPFNRESLWPYYNRSTALYQFIKDLASLRKQHLPSLNSGHQTTRYSDSDTLIFSTGVRDEVVFCLTNSGGNISQIKLNWNVGNLYPEGTVFQNYFDTDDKQQITNSSMTVIFKAGNPLVYIRQLPEPEVDGSNMANSLAIGGQVSRIFTCTFIFITVTVLLTIIR